MPRVAKNPGGPKGRPTKEAELKEFAEAAGVDMEKVADFLGGALEPEEIPSAKDIRERLLLSLSNRLGELKGIALVQALKAISALAAIEEQEQTTQDVTDERRPLLDRIEALPPEHATVLVKQELARIDTYKDDLFAALAALEGK